MNKAASNTKIEGISQMISYLKSNNATANVYKVLVQIRNDVIKDNEGISELKEKGGIKCLVKLLSKTNMKMLNVVLSILANCCMQEECRFEAVNYGVISPLLSLLRNINEDNIQSRLCRLIGNLAQSHKPAVKLHEAGVVSPLVQVLKTSNSISTQLMAIRALRLLWNTNNTYNLSLLTARAVVSIASYLGSENSDLTKASLHALATFTKNCSCNVALQVKDGANGLEKLVAKISDQYAAQCLYNLSHVSIARIELIKACLVEAIVNKLSSHTDSSLMNTLCLLCRESGGRAHLRHTSGGLPLMVTALRSCSYQNQHSRILNALNHFLFDEPSLKILAQAGLVSVLIEKLTHFISKNGTIHQAEEKPIEEPMNSGSVSPSSSGFSPIHYACSPAGGWSPPSPIGSVSTAGAYSPLCISDEELETSPNLADDEPMEEEEKSSVSLPIEETEEGSSILELLCYVAYMDSPVGAMADKSTITTLIDYIRLLRSPNIKARKVLCSIAGNKNYYKKLLDEQMVLIVHGKLCRPVHSVLCTECGRIANEGAEVLHKVSLLAESGLGEGEMKYRLLKADSDTKMTVSLTIPYVIRERYLLLKLLVEYKALGYLFDALNDKSEDAVSSFNALFRTLEITSRQEQLMTCLQCDIGSLRREGTLMFLLDDGSTVSANKTSLCNISPFFEAMFRGGFKESDQTCVRLGDISAACLTSFLRIVDGFCECILPKDIHVLLELVIATDRFLVLEFTQKILSYVMNCRLSYKCAYVVYGWAIENGYKYDIATGVAVNVVKYIISGDMSPKQRLEGVSLILDSKHCNDFINSMQNLIRDELCKRPIPRPERRKLECAY